MARPAGRGGRRHAPNRLRVPGGEDRHPQRAHTPGPLPPHRRPERAREPGLDGGGAPGPSLRGRLPLDKLLERGLLEVDFARLLRLSRAGGGTALEALPGSGRQLELSVPERHYDLAGQLLAQALTEAELRSV